MTGRPRKPLYQRIIQKVWVAPNNCWIFQGGPRNRKYGLVSVGGRAGRNVKAHRAMWYAIHGKLPNEFILHSCDNPRCVNPNHLSLGDHNENMQQMKDRGRSAKGEDNGKAQFKTWEILDIRYLYHKGVYSQRTLGEMYGVSHVAIRKIVNRRSWKHV